MEKQEEERQRLLQGVLARQIRVEDDLPLKRNEKPDGAINMIIPEAMMPLVMFVAWLNEKVEDL